MASVSEAKSLSGLLSGIVHTAFFGNTEVSDELLKNELYPDLSQEEFGRLRDKMSGLLKSIVTADMDQSQLQAFLTAQTKKSRVGGVSSEQAAALAHFWRTQRLKVRQSLLSHSCWEPCLRGLSWRVDLSTASTKKTSTQSDPVMLLEFELGRISQASQYVCLECDNVKMNKLLSKMRDIQEIIDCTVCIC